MFGIKDKASKHLKIAIIDQHKCRPKKCNKECKNVCPKERQGYKCIDIEEIAVIYDNMCIGCGACVKVCPFGAIRMINYPRDLESNMTHQYGINSFRLHKLPIPKKGCILGLLGANGLGKTTALDILAGKYRPNFGRLDQEASWEELNKSFRGTELQNFFNLQKSGKFTTKYKTQNIDRVKKMFQDRDTTILEHFESNHVSTQYLETLDLEKIKDRSIKHLSGGELQRFMIAYACGHSADLFIFDEPTCYLDISQRLRASRAIMGKMTPSNYIVLVEHDLAILDYLSDNVVLFYGFPSGYGVATLPFSAREGINYFLDGYIPLENMQFRPEAISFKFSVEETIDDQAVYTYPAFTKTLGDFTLDVEEGTFFSGEVVVMLGENGMGKTTMAEIIAGKIPMDPKVDFGLSISYKEQIISPDFQGTVEDWLQSAIGNTYLQPIFQSDIMGPLRITDLMDVKVSSLSGGELQRVAIAITLGRPAQMYLFDEPSAFLDAESRIMVARIIKRHVRNHKKVAFVVDHDLLMNMYLADRMILFTGEPGINGKASAPDEMKKTINQFLKNIDVTVRRDPTNFRPRINKPGSQKDQEQKKKNQYI